MTKNFTLKEILDARKAEWAEKAPQERKKLYEEGIEEVRREGVVEAALQVGDKAPDFTLTNAIGKEISLYEALKNGPVVLTWYRGGWCPYCNLTLQRLQVELPQLTAAGGQLIALSPELPDNSLSTTQKHELQFEVLSDEGNKVAEAYGIVYKLNPEVAAIYEKSFGLNIINGDKSNELPLAAAYVIDTDARITYAFLDPDYRKRAEPQEILDALNKIK